MSRHQILLRSPFQDWRKGNHNWFFDGERILVKKMFNGIIFEKAGKKSYKCFIKCFFKENLQGLETGN